MPFVGIHSAWQWVDGLTLLMLILLLTIVLVRRPPAVLWPSLPLTLTATAVFVQRECTPPCEISVRRSKF